MNRPQTSEKMSRTTTRVNQTDVKARSLKKGMMKEEEKCE